MLLNVQPSLRKDKTNEMAGNEKASRKEPEKTSVKNGVKCSEKQSTLVFSYVRGFTTTKVMTLLIYSSMSMHLLTLSCPP